MSRRLKLFILLIAIASGSIVYAGAGADGESVSLTVGRSTVVDTGMPIARVSLTSADVADALVTSPSELLINGKTPGTISMFVWNRAGGIKRYEINVQRDLARLTSQLKELFPNEKIEARANGRAIVLSGAVSNKDVIDRAVSLAGGYVDKKEDVITLLQLAEGAPSNQVLLRVRFAEVSRSALTELGVNFFTSPAGYKDVQGRVTTQQFPAPVFDSSNGQPKLVFSDYLNFFLWDFKHDIGGVVKALQTRGLFQSLAEPNLVAESGKEASFLAGGELPIPVAQPGGAGVAVTIMWKEFGIRLNFTPQVNGDRVHLKVRPEVSTLDFNNAITLQGFRIPALSTRRTETELELVNGQTFAIAGLMNNQMNKSLQKIPGIGDIPILGLLFRSEAAQKDRTELVVMITPQILRNNSPGVTNELPRTPETFLPPVDPKRSKEMPPPAFPPVPPRSGAANNAVPTPVPAAAANQDPATAAAKMQALTPSTRPIVNGDAQPASTETPASTVSRPLTPQEQKMMQRARQQEMEARKMQEAAAKKLRDKVAGDQSRKDAESSKQAVAAARRQAEADKAAQAVAAKRNAEIAKKQAEIDKKRQKEIAEAEAKLKAAQAAYEAELAKAKKKDQDQ